MSSVPHFVAELVRAANELERLTAFETTRLLDRAVTTIRDMREQVGIPSRGTATDALIGIEATSAAIAVGSAAHGDVRAALLEAADMVRTLHVLLDSDTEIRLTFVE